MFEKMLGVSWLRMVLILRFKGVGGCRGVHMFAFRGWGDVDG